MINVLIGIFYIALIALISYLLYYIIKIAIKDAYYEIEFKADNDYPEEKRYENTDIDENNWNFFSFFIILKRKYKKYHYIFYEGDKYEENYFNIKFNYNDKKC